MACLGWSGNILLVAGILMIPLANSVTSSSLFFYIPQRMIWKEASGSYKKNVKMSTNKLYRRASLSKMRMIRAKLEPELAAHSKSNTSSWQTYTCIHFDRGHLRRRLGDDGDIARLRQAQGKLCSRGADQFLTGKSYRIIFIVMACYIIPSL